MMRLVNGIGQTETIVLSEINKVRKFWFGQIMTHVVLLRDSVVLFMKICGLGELLDSDGWEKF